MWVSILALPHLSVGAPLPVAVPGVPEVGPGNPLEATTRVETRRQFVGECLVLNKLVFACRRDGRFVQALGVQLSTFDAGDFRADQERAVFEILGAVLRPFHELPVVGGQGLEMLRAFFGGRRITTCGMAQRTIEMGFRRLKKGWGCPEQGLRIQRGVHRGPVVSGHEARLHLSYPVPTRDAGRGPVACQAPLKRQFIELRLVEPAERRRMTTECADQRKLCRDYVDHEIEVSLPAELETSFGLPLHVWKWIANREQVRDQIHARISRRPQLTGGIRKLKCSTQQLGARPQMSGPGDY